MERPAPYWKGPLLAAGVIALLILGAVLLMHGDRWLFEGRLVAGMTQDQVLKKVGTPERVVRIGGTLSKWGDVQACVVTQETWVYYLMPKSQHREILEFQKDKLVRLEHQQN